MPNYAVIENGKVANLCVAEPSDIKPANWVLCETGGIGWDYVDGQFIDDRPKSPVPEITEPPAPTKEQLMAELAALTAKIQALE
jgi:hypothetical protein